MFFFSISTFVFLYLLIYKISLFWFDNVGLFLSYEQLFGKKVGDSGPA